MKPRVFAAHFVALLGGLALHLGAWGQPCPLPYSQARFPQLDTVTVTFGANRTNTNLPIDLQADVYTPQGDTSPRRPCVIVLFGGGFITGSRRDAAILQTCGLLAQRGMVAVGADYRIGLGFPFQQSFSEAVYRATQDAKACVRYMRANAAQFRIDTNNIFLCGFSAGAVTSLHAIFWQQNEVPVTVNTSSLGPLEGASNNLNTSSRVRGVLAAAGALGDTLWQQGDVTPVGMVHNTTDGTVPYGTGLVPFVGVPAYGSSLVHRGQLRQGAFSRLHTLNVQGLHLPEAYTPLADTLFRYLSQYLLEMLDCPSLTSVPAQLSQATPRMDFYPNPGSGLYHWRSDSPQASWEAEVLAPTGQLVLRQPLEEGQALDLRPFPAGLYQIRAISRGKAYLSRQVVKH